MHGDADIAAIASVIGHPARGRMLTALMDGRALREGNRSLAHRAARSCYDHLAGAVGVAVTEGLCAAGALDAADLSLRDGAPFVLLGVDAAALRRGRRPLTRSCVDWSERRP